MAYNYHIYVLFLFYQLKKINYENWINIIRKTRNCEKNNTKYKGKKDKLQGWGLLLAMTHKHETYDFFKIPKYKDEVDGYYRNNPIIFDTYKGVSVKKSKQK